MKKFILPLLAFLMGGGSYYAEAQALTYDESLTFAAAHYKDWIEQLPDGAYVANLSLPGSHDAGSHALSGSSKVQDLTVTEQLNHGVRVLDIRTGIEDGKLVIVHGISSSSTSLATQLNQIHSWLEEHPKEFVILITHKDRSGDDEATWAGLMTTDFAAHDECIMPYSRNVTVGELRGKIMVFNREDWDTTKKMAFIDPMGDNEPYRNNPTVTLTDGTRSKTKLYEGVTTTGVMTFQDYYDQTVTKSVTGLTNTSGSALKSEAILKVMGESTAYFGVGAYEMRWFLNHTSGFTEKIGIGSLLAPTISNIRNNAKDRNWDVLNYLQQATYVPGPLGFMLTDFAGKNTSGTVTVRGEDFVKAVIGNNFRYINTTPAKEKIYLYNVGQGKYLSQGADWGMRAVLATHAEAVCKEWDGTYYNFRLLNQTNYLGSNCFVDNGTKANWTATDNGDGTYSLSCSGGSNFGWTGTELNYDATGDNAKWKFITNDDVLEAMETATTTNGVDITGMYLPGNALHCKNSAFSDSWAGVSGVTLAASKDKNPANSVVEVYDKESFDLYQRVFLQPGVYKFTVGGFYRCGDKSGSKETRLAGNEQLNANLYATVGTQTLVSPLMSIYDGKERGNNNWTTYTYDNIPNDVTEATTFIFNGSYDGNALVFKVEEATYVKLGVRKNVYVSKDWTAINNFGLEYFGPVTQFENATKASPLDVTALTSTLFNNPGNAQSTSSVSDKPELDNSVYAGPFWERWSGKLASGSLAEQSFVAPFEGSYTLKAYIFGSVANAFYAYVGESKTYQAVANKGTLLSVTGATAVDATTFYFGCGKSDDAAYSSAQWTGIGSNYQLLYEGTNVDVETLLNTYLPYYNTAMGYYNNSNVSNKATLGSDFAPFDANVRADLYTAAPAPATLTTSQAVLAQIRIIKPAIKNAEESIADYVEYRQMIDNMNKLLKSTNVVSAAAKSTFENKITSYNSQWDNGTIVDGTVRDPFVVTGWHVNPLDASDFLIGNDKTGTNDATCLWTVGAAGSENPLRNYQESSLHVNTWSAEGGSDNTNFTVPFYEYYSGDSPLTPETFNVTIPNLTAGTRYEFSVLARVTCAKDATPQGIYLKANGEDQKMSMCWGEKFAQTSNDREFDIFYGTFFATGVADNDGKLKVSFLIEEGNNVVWLSFKNLYVKPHVKNNYFDVTTDVQNITDVTIGSGLGVNTYAKDYNEATAPYYRLNPVPYWYAFSNNDARAGGLFAYGSNSWLGGTGDKVPANCPTAAELADNISHSSTHALGIEAVWNNRAQYVSPHYITKAGAYKFTITYVNQSGSQAPEESFIGVADGTTGEWLAHAEPEFYTIGKWQTKSLEFTVDKPQTVVLSFGYKAGNYGNGSAMSLFLNCVHTDALQPNKFVTVESTLPEAQRQPNCIYNNGTAAEPDWKSHHVYLTDAFLYDNALENIAADAVTYKRKFNNTDWQALYLPFDIDLDEMCNTNSYASKNGSEYDIIEINRYTDGGAENDYVVFHRLVDGIDKELKANTPYLMKSAATGEREFTFSAHDIKAAAVEEVPIAGYKLVGNYETVTDMKSEQSYVLKGGLFYHVANDEVKLNPFRVRLVPVSAAAMSASLNIRIEDETDGIYEIDNKRMECNKFYDLNGIEVENPREGQVYIFNGIKVIFK